MPAIAQTPAGSDPAEPGLTAARAQAFAEALKKKDVESLKHTLTDDFHVIWSDGHLYGKDQILDAASELQEFSPYNLRVLPMNDSAAVATYDCIVIAPEGDDQTAPRYQRFAELWVKQGSEWRLKFLQATPLRSID
jgi:hypothetical protein